MNFVKAIGGDTFETDPSGLLAGVAIEFCYRSDRGRIYRHQSEPDDDAPGRRLQDRER